MSATGVIVPRTLGTGGRGAPPGGGGGGGRGGGGGGGGAPRPGGGRGAGGEPLPPRGELPRDDVRVVLHLRDQHLVARGEPGAEGVRQEGEADGRDAGWPQ